MSTRQEQTRRRNTDPSSGKIEQEDDNQFVSAVARGMQVFDACARARRPIGNSEIAEATGLSAPTVSRIAYTLYRSGYLDFHPRERTYSPGGKAVGQASAILRRIGARSIARPLMEQLSRDAHFNVGLGTLDGDLMVYTDAFEGDGLIALRLRAGSHIPVLTSAMGRAYLAGLDDMSREALMERLRPGYGDEWGAIRSGVERAREEIARHGYCLSVGDWQKEIHGIAAPIVQASDNMVFSLNLGGPAYLLPETLLRETLAPKLLAVVAQVNVALGEQ